ncbi:hypothetical protein BJ878DRAFT_255006 [Calycina marina]|uniref:Uncharacterized protein n=1 Tax=Calycina marina TaxID=1763456 RepID=A0A9P8CBV9_9HELO|nr:hypothetical protein BJ878DRAFT_255006 [Calycina marina]
MSKTFIPSRSVKSSRIAAGRESSNVSDPRPSISDVNITRKFGSSGQPGRDRLPERPSTSGGAIKSSMRKSSVRRETKDDLHFNPLTAHTTGNNLYYNFPSPAQSPNLYSPLPKESPLPQRSPLPRTPLPKSPNLRSEIPEPIAPDTDADADADATYMMNVRQEQYSEAPIGMALGSPAHPPSGWQAQEDSSARVMLTEQDMSSDGWATPPVAATRVKGSRWKLLGGLFTNGRKNSEPQTFYQVRQEPFHQVTIETDSGNFVEPPMQKGPKQRGRTTTSSGHHDEKKKPDMMRSNTAPMKIATDLAKTPGAPEPPEFVLNNGRKASGTGAGDAQQSQNGLLNVDIPTTHLERYSVMFGGVLGNSPNAPSSSSLLARRQATLDRLKTANEELAAKERELEARAQLLRPRRATSPQPAKSPAFSLFPSTPSRLTVRQPSPLQRSNTSPAALSPSRQMFAHIAEDNEMHASLLGPAPHIPVDPTPNPPRPKLAASFRKKRDPVPSLNSVSSLDAAKDDSRQRKQSLDKSQNTFHLELDSDDDDKAIRVSFTKPKLEEPTWKMVNSSLVTSVSAGSSSLRSGDHSISTSVSSVSNSAGFSTTQPQKKVGIQAATIDRRRRVTTTTTTSAPRTFIRPAEVSNEEFGASIASINVTAPQQTISKDDTPKVAPKQAKIDLQGEEHLRTAVDISIARQISVSRQQRQLLIPITKPTSPSTHKSASPKPPPSSNSNGLRKPISVTALPSMRHNPNFPSPVASLNHARSPLAMVSDPESPITGLNTPLVPARMATAPVKPSTPTLVVTGNDDYFARGWGGPVRQTPIQTFLHERGRGGGGGGYGSSVNAVGGNRKSESVVLESY